MLKKVFRREIAEGEKSMKLVFEGFLRVYQEEKAYLNGELANRNIKYIYGFLVVFLGLRIQFCLCP